eukprot:TRINITY_DN5241_c1_g1_i1.p1 TRINITY_DN5241_c1_g1~~TRINITY_DN5241_c1_g1_i1.p1  ORF type:complete len:291 (+),score=39.07 TRINITY_DN5241_c1_g1_i1:100-972(+)
MSCPRGEYGSKRVSIRKIKCRSRVAQCLDAVNTFLTGSENYCDLPDIHSDSPMSSSGESDDLPAPVATASRVVTMGAARSLPPCQHFLAGKCWLESFCEHPHVAAAALKKPDTAAKAVTVPETETKFLQVRKWFWLENAKGYHEVCRWVAFPESATPKLDKVVDHQLMTVSVGRNLRPVQVLSITQTACWVVVNSDIDTLTTSYIPLPYSCTEALEFSYSRTCDTRCAVTWDRVRYLVDFTTMEMRSSADDTIHCIVRQPATLRLSCPPSRSDNSEKLERVLSASFTTFK